MQTPFEINGTWTTAQDEKTFVNSLVPLGARVDILGHSVNSLPIRSVSVGNVDAENVCVYVATQHGTEPAPREAAIAIARDLVATTDPDMISYLENTQWVIVPTMNVDNVLLSRRNANGVDLNRDWQTLEQPETQAVATLFDLRPVLILDSHEYGSEPVGETDVACNVPNSEAVDAGIIDLSDSLRTLVAQGVQSHGSTYSHYDSSTTTTVLRNAAALQHATTLLVETWQNEANNPNRDVPTRSPQLRVSDHQVAFYAALEHHRENVELYKLTSNKSRDPFDDGGGKGYYSLPWLNIWDTPKTYVNGKPVIDASLNINGTQYRVSDHLGQILG